MSTIGVKAIKYPDGDSAINITDGGNVTLAGTLGVTGAATFSSDITVTENNANASTDITVLNANGVATVGNQAKLHLGTTNSTSHGASIIGEFTGTANTNHATDLIFKTTNTGSSLIETMRINASGNVGIGTNSPSVPSGTALEIYGSSASRLKLSNSTTGTGATDGFQIYTSGSSAIIEQKENAEMRFYTNASERVRISSAGNVGIGTTAPTSPLHVVSGEIGNGSNKGIKIANHNASKAYSIRTGITGSENTSLSIHDDTAGVSRITVDTSGRVGIGANNMGSYQANNDDLVIATSGSTGITIRSGQTDQGRIAFADGTDDLTTEMRGLLMYNHNGNAMSFFTNSAERMRITSAGLVNIGSTNPYSMLDVTSNTDGNTTITASAQITQANNFHDFALGNREAYAVGIRRTLTQSTPAYLRPRMDFFVQGYNTYLPADRTVAMTILDSKQVSIGVTSTLGNARVAIDADNLIYCLICKANASNGAFILFQKDDGSTIGNIDHTASATRYVTSSDYRLKENVSYDFDATSRLKQLKPARFNFIADETDTLVDGFLAHEVSSIVPEAIRGEKDAVDEDGNIDPQGIDQSKLVPLLVKAMQEQQATIEALTARITALEGS